jgi:hypothetical protein
MTVHYRVNLSIRGKWTHAKLVKDAAAECYDFQVAVSMKRTECKKDKKN